MAFNILRNKLIARGYWNDTVGDAGSAAPSTEGTATATDTTAQPGATDQGASAPAGTLLGDSKTQADGSSESDAGQPDASDKPAPTEYADFTLPEGMQTNDDVMAAFKETALNAGLTQEQAQTMIEMGALQQQKILEAHFNAVEQQKADWEAEARADKEYGGAKFEESLAYAAKARDAFVTPALREQLDKTGLGNHPDLIRVFVRAGKLISEDSLVPGDSKPTPQAKSAAATLYPNQG